MVGSIAPRNIGGSGDSPLAAVCVEPQDPKAPIIISFRGTETLGDVVSDARLTTMGVIEQKFRNAAFEFYQDVRKKYPDREIVLTGHSLGGHLAQYVGTKAYNTDPKLRPNQLLQVRTFNSAPIDTTHSAVFNTNPELLSQFVNYRLSPDIVSNLPLQHHYGNTFVFPSDQGTLNSHKLGVLKKLLPEKVMNQEITSHDPIEKKQNQLIELIKGVESSYQCRVEGQFFSRFRAGAKNLREMQEAFPAILASIEKGEYSDAVSKLKILKGKLDGTTSTHLVDAIIQRTNEVKELNQKMQQTETVTATPHEQQTDLRALFKRMREESVPQDTKGLDAHIEHTEDTVNCKNG